jgi:hypothetical protein
MAVAVIELERAMMRLFLNAVQREGLLKISCSYQISEAPSHLIPLVELKEKKTTTKRGMKRNTMTKASMMYEKEKLVFLEYVW